MNTRIFGMWKKENSAERTAWHNQLDGTMEGLVFEMETSDRREVCDFLDTPNNRLHFEKIKPKLMEYRAHEREGLFKKEPSFRSFITHYRLAKENVLQISEDKLTNANLAQVLLRPDNDFD